MDGIAGLGFSGLASVTSPTLLDTLRRQYPSSKHQFSVYLAGPNDVTPSHLRYGGYDLSLVSANASFLFSPVVRHRWGPLSYWTLEVEAVT